MNNLFFRRLNSRFAPRQRNDMYLHQRNNWWKFSYDKEAVMNKLGPVRAKQGLILGRMLSLGFDFQDEAMLTTMSLELVRSCEIEGEHQISSSISITEFWESNFFLIFTERTAKEVAKSVLCITTPDGIFRSLGAKFHMPLIP